MIKQDYFRLVMFILFFIVNTALWGQNSKSINVVTTAVPFLRVCPDATAGGMGDVGIATSPDVSSAFWNIGKLPFNENKGGVLATYTPWLKDWVNDMYMASISGYHKLDEIQTIHGSFRYFNLGDIQFADNMGNHLQSFHPREWGIDAGYSRKLSDRIGIGIGIKYIRSNLANNGAGGIDYKAGNAMAADLGIYYTGRARNGNGWSLGAALSNLGTKISYSDNADSKNYIPANLGLGASYLTLFSERSKIIFALDVNKLLVPTPPSRDDDAALVDYRNKSVISSWFSSFSDAPGGFKEELKEFQISVGTEFSYDDQFAFRIGYFYEDKSKGDRRYLTVGAGFRYNIIGFNLSYLVPTGSSINRNPLSNSLRLGIVLTKQ